MCERTATVIDQGTLLLPPAGHFVYRHISHTGEVLYVGITDGLFRRCGEHQRDSSWWRSVARVEWERFDERREAADQEVLLINAFLPPHNVRSVGWAVPSAKAV